MVQLKNITNPPSCVALDSEDRIVASFKADERVLVFDCNGDVLRDMYMDEPLDDPFIVHVDGANQLYVIDRARNHGTVFVVDGETGETVKQYNLPDQISSMASNPALGWMYFLSSRTSQVFIVRQDGAFIRSFGTYGTYDGEFNHPRCILVQQCSHNVVVVDSGNDRLQVFDCNGEYTRTIAGKGSGVGELVSPHFACTDKRDNVVVCDTGNNRVQCFDGVLANKVLWTVDVAGSATDPQSVALDSDGDVLVFNGKELEWFTTPWDPELDDLAKDASGQDEDGDVVEGKQAAVEQSHPTGRDEEEKQRHRNEEDRGDRNEEEKQSARGDAEGRNQKEEKANLNERRRAGSSSKHRSRPATDTENKPLNRRRPSKMKQSNTKPRSSSTTTKKSQKTASAKKRNLATGKRNFVQDAKQQEEDLRELRRNCKKLLAERNQFKKQLERLGAQEATGGKSDGQAVSALVQGFQASKETHSSIEKMQDPLLLEELEIEFKFLIQQLSENVRQLQMTKQEVETKNRASRERFAALQSKLDTMHPNDRMLLGDAERQLAAAEAENEGLKGELQSLKSQEAAELEQLTSTLEELMDECEQTKASVRQLRQRKEQAVLSSASRETRMASLRQQKAALEEQLGSYGVDEPYLRALFDGYCTKTGADVRVLDAEVAAEALKQAYEERRAPNLFHVPKEQVIAFFTIKEQQVDFNEFLLAFASLDAA